jgi:hypothetical protein
MNLPAPSRAGCGTSEIARRGDRNVCTRGEHRIRKKLHVKVFRACVAAGIAHLQPPCSVARHNRPSGLYAPSPVETGTLTTIPSCFLAGNCAALAARGPPLGAVAVAPSLGSTTKARAPARVSGRQIGVSSRNGKNSTLRYCQVEVYLNRT